MVRVCQVAAELFINTDLGKSICPLASLRFPKPHHKASTSFGKAVGRKVVDTHTKLVAAEKTRVDSFSTDFVMGFGESLTREEAYFFPEIGIIYRAGNINV